MLKQDNKIEPMLAMQSWKVDLQKSQKYRTVIKMNQKYIIEECANHINQHAENTKKLCIQMLNDEMITSLGKNTKVKINECNKKDCLHNFGKKIHTRKTFSSSWD